MKRFIFDTILDEANICNLDQERLKLEKGVDDSLKLLVYGRRNTGKTSLVKNVVAKNWKNKNSTGFFMYVDLMGVKGLEQVSERVTIAFSEAYNQSFQMKAAFQNMLKIIKGISPTLEVDDKGYPKLSFSIQTGSKTRYFVDVFEQLEAIYRSGVPVLLVLDEFQDIYGTEQAEALFRNSLQNLNPNIPVVILGSKQHLLSKIFARPDAPFFNWGTHVNFNDIDYKIYHDYMNERFNQEGLKISLDSSQYLQDKMARVPEAINRLCYALITMSNIKEEILVEHIDGALEQLIADRRSEPEKYLSGFTLAEQKVIVAIARNGPVSQPQNKNFVKSVNLSSPGVRKIFTKLENDAVIYKKDNGYVLSDPLLRQHILIYRL